MILKQNKTDTKTVKVNKNTVKQKNTSTKTTVKTIK